MNSSKTKKTKQRSFSKTRNKYLRIRVPEDVLECINILVDLGLFKDRNEFINYSLQETIKNYLMNIKIEITPELINRYFTTLEQISPGSSEEETLKLLKDLRTLRRKHSFEDPQNSR